jgi:hypothetical protein
MQFRASIRSNGAHFIPQLGAVLLRRANRRDSVIMRVSKALPLTKVRSVSISGAQLYQM